jgi:hypothetical protein
MHHYFAPGKLAEDESEFQIVPGASGCIMLECNRLQNLLNK